MDEAPDNNGSRVDDAPATGMRYYARDFWSDENLKYVEPHFRMLKSARVITRLAGNRELSLLDVGCGPATLKRLIPPTVRYHGIDIAIHGQDPNLREADIVKSPITFGDQHFDIVIAQGFFEYVGDYEAQKFDEIAQLLAPGGTFIVSYVNFGHRRPEIYERYSNVRSIEEFRDDLRRNFTIRQCLPTSHNWAHHEPTQTLVRAGNMRMNLNVPLLTPWLAVQYLFICSGRDDARKEMR